MTQHSPAPGTKRGPLRLQLRVQGQRWGCHWETDQVVDGLMGPAKKFGLYSLGSGDPLRNMSKGETLVRLPFFSLARLMLTLAKGWKVEMIREEKAPKT